MTEQTKAVLQHYEGEAREHDLLAQVTLILDGMQGEPITAKRLAGLDQFHVRGLQATADFAALLGIEPGMQVLDAGSGLGGPSRYVAENFDCQVTGVDLTRAFVTVAQLLADRAGMSEQVSYQPGNLLALDFPDEHFDVVYTQHVVMNIHDREQVYREIRRVLKPDGRFGFYDVLAADGKPAPLYPLMWAEHSEHSVLLTEAETRAALQQAGLVPEIWNDVTELTVDWLADQPSPPLPQGPNLMLVMGPRFAQMSANFARNLRENKLRLVMAVSVRNHE
ncbi:class I SAM-dependent methyltransferase [Pseudomonas sp. NA-150]|uniref:class I SAM-dependent methyltransferase n=1 Tax=Pseudomonas sp. NA-150 TaxID=3367525 RepID=UPI0037CA7C9B